MRKFTYRNLAECRHHFLLMVNLPLFSVILHLTRFNCWSDFKFFVFLFAFVTLAACVAISFFLFIYSYERGEERCKKQDHQTLWKGVDWKKIGHRQAGFLVGCMCLSQPAQYASMQFWMLPSSFYLFIPNLSLLCYTHGYWLYQTYSSMTWQFCKSHFWATLFFVFFLYYQHRLIHDPLAVFLLNSLYVAASN